MDADRVHVELWWIDLRFAAAREEELRRLLPADELARAARYRLPASRVQFVAARSVLRAELGRRLGCDPQQLELALLPGGKPHLVRHPRLGFSLSHSRSRAVVAIADDPCVGVDIEYVDRSVDTDLVAAQLFSASVHDELGFLDSQERIPAFYRQWTRTEAVAKADGSGLGDSIPDVGFDVLPSGATRTVDKWAVVDVDVGSEYAAAVAAPVTRKVGGATGSAGPAAAGLEICQRVWS